MNFHLVLLVIAVASIGFESTLAEPCGAEIKDLLVNYFEANVELLTKCATEAELQVFPPLGRVVTDEETQRVCKSVSCMTVIKALKPKVGSVNCDLSTYNTQDIFQKYSHCLVETSNPSTAPAPAPSDASTPAGNPGPANAPSPYSTPCNGAGAYPEPTSSGTSGCSLPEPTPAATPCSSGGSNPEPTPAASTPAAPAATPASTSTSEGQVQNSNQQASSSPSSSVMCSYLFGAALSMLLTFFM